MSEIRKRIIYRLLVWLGPWVIRLIGFTLRLERVNASGTDAIIKAGQPFLFCVWHGRLFLPVFYHRRQAIVAMVSQHTDGEIIARIIKGLGYGTVRGSSTRGGKKAFLQLLVHLKNGGRAAMIPDGPTGPRFQLKIGTLLLAQRAGSPLIPITFAARPCWRFRTWDRMVLPKPFARAVLCYGDPLILPEKTSPEELEAWRLKLERSMMDLVKSAEAQVGGIMPEETEIVSRA